MEIKTYKEFQNLVDNKSFSGAIIIYGENKEYINKSIERVYSKVKSFEEFNIIKIQQEDINMDKVVNACETIPFMSDKKIIHINNPSFLKKKEKTSSNEGEPKDSSDLNELYNFLFNYINTIEDNIILLITLNADIDIKNKVYKAVQNGGSIVQYRLQRPDDIQLWTNDMFKSYEKSINKGDLIYFINECGNDINKIQQEIDKLCSYALNESTITREHIDLVISKSFESNIFKMVDNIIKKDIDKAITILDTLLFQKEDFTRILGMIIRQFRLLYLVKLEAKNTKNYLEIKNKLKLNEYVVKNLLNQTSRYTEKDISVALNKCLECDYKIKNGGVQSELGLEMLLADLCR